MSAETPEPARFYYEVYSWSGCAGSTWERMTGAERDAWRHAERVARILSDRLAARDAAYAARLAAVEAERDAALGALHVAPEVLRLAEMSNQVDAWMTRAEKAEAERGRLRAAVATLDTGHRDACRFPDDECGCAVMIGLFDLRAVLDQHPGPDDAREGA